ncbi:MAG TPA: hypothetical protein VLS92_01100 [Acidimicrobiia bacterium]|nr:hypothetical protein [Acidimicrobiia bacterium]
MAAAAALAVIAAGCAGEDDGDSGTGATGSTTATAETTTTAASDDGAIWIVSLLDRIPDTETSGHEVTPANLAGAAEASGIELAAAGAPAAEVTSFFAGLPTDTALPQWFLRSITRADELRAQLGVDLAAISAAVEAGTLPAQFLVLAGDFDATAIDAASRADPVWSDLLATAEHAGVPYFSWGRDFKTRSSVSRRPIPTAAAAA